MHTLRRVFALATSLLVVALAVKPLSAECAVPAPAEAAMPDMPGHEHHAPPPDEGAPAPRTAAMPVCCLSLASCGQTVIASGRVLTVASHDALAIVATGADVLPRSPFFAPDPPPPRA